MNISKFVRMLPVVLVLALGSTTAMAIDPAEIFDNPQKEERARDIFRQLRCMVCQNQSIFDSNAGLAKDLRLLVRERIEAGDNDEQIFGYVSERYGDYVLLEPPFGSHTLMLWIAPFVIVFTGCLVAVPYLKSRRKPRGSQRLDREQREAAQQLLRGDEA